jgi:hypothetical protein
VLTRDGNTLRKQTILVRVPVSVFNLFFFLNMFYTHKHSIKLCSNTYINLINYLIVYFKSYLCSIGRVRNASDADISVIFP